MKKLILLFSLFILLSLGNVQTFATSLSYSMGSVSQQEIYEDVVYVRSQGTSTNDAGATTQQNVNAIIKNSDANIQVVTWNRFNSSGQWTMGTVEEIARHFEAHNPGYRVISAVNADYFAYSPTRTISANMIMGGHIFKANNHEKYLSVGFDYSAQELVSNKRVSYGDYALTIYNKENNGIDFVIPLQGLNTNALGDNRTSVFYNTNNMNINDAKKYVVSQPTAISYMDLHLFGKGEISQITSENRHVSNQEFVVVTNDSAVMAALDEKPMVRVQRLVTGDFNQSDIIIGVDSQILMNGAVRPFNAIGGQSDSNNQSRHPRTGFCVTANQDFVMATVDGRQASGPAGIYSSGVNLREFAEVMRSFDCVDGFNLDGGGSTQMIIRNSSGGFDVVNSPSEGPHFPSNHSLHRIEYRRVANALLFVVPDINVNANYSNFTRDGLTLDFEIQANDDVAIHSQKLIVNNQEISLDEGIETIELRDLNDNGLNVINFQFTYEINSNVYTRVFHQKIIDLSVDSGIREAQIPHNFVVEFRNDESVNGFKVFVSYDDPDSMLSRISVIRLDNNQRLTAFVEHRGTRAAVVSDAELGKEYSFRVEYFYDLNTKSATLDEVFTYVYQLHEEEVENNEDASFVLYGAIALSIVLVIATGIIMIRKSRR